MSVVLLELFPMYRVYLDVIYLLALAELRSRLCTDVENKVQLTPRLSLQGLI